MPASECDLIRIQQFKYLLLCIKTILLIDFDEEKEFFPIFRNLKDFDSTNLQQPTID